MDDGTLPGFIMGALLATIIMVVAIWTAPPPDLGPGCRIFVDGGAICEDENSSWYFEEGTFN